MKNNDVLLLCKAFNGRVVQHWLTMCMVEASQQPHFADQDERFPLMTLAMFLGVFGLHQPYSI